MGGRNERGQRENIMDLIDGPTTPRDSLRFLTSLERTFCFCFLCLAEERADRSKSVSMGEDISESSGRELEVTGA